LTEIPGGGDAINQLDLDLPHMGEFEKCLGDGTGLGDRAFGIARDLASEPINLLRQLRIEGHRGRETMSVRIAARSLFAAGRSGTGALDRVPPVGGDLPFACHGLGCRLFRGTPLEGRHIVSDDLIRARA